MLVLSSHQQRLLESGLSAIEKYFENEITFTDVTSRLHGAIQASEIKDPIFDDRFHELWMPLEVLNASL
jgi:hypothetical protein